MAKKEDRKRIALIGGPYDGETLVDTFLNVLDRQSGPDQPTVRYYRDPNVRDCFLVDDPNDSRLLIYKVQELTKGLDRLKMCVTEHDAQLDALDARFDRHCFSTSRSWWERLCDRLDLPA